MFERRFNAIAFRDFMVAICLTLVAGCNAAVDSTAPEAPVDGALPAPTGLVAMPGSAQANLSWSASNGATRYLVKRSTTSGGPYGQVATAMSPAYTDATVSNGATYYYVIAAANADSMSADSAQAAVTLAAGGGRASPGAHRPGCQFRHFGGKPDLVCKRWRNALFCQARNHQRRTIYASRNSHLDVLQRRFGHQRHRVLLRRLGAQFGWRERQFRGSQRHARCAGSPAGGGMQQPRSPRNLDERHAAGLQTPTIALLPS